ncbi:MAG: RRXRR domain-containing protein, partial [Limnospira sp. PMC 1238.20]|uniref:RRXRR domain-containing protein n=1 Tax=Limnospira sp. PMC 1238.20 TaxID=2981036 RepID=UPI0028E0D901
MPNYQNYVFVVDTLGQPLSPTHPARARKLLKQGLAAVFRTYLFTIIALVKVVRTQLGERNPWHHGENQTV